MRVLGFRQISPTAGANQLPQRRAAGPGDGSYNQLQVMAYTHDGLRREARDGLRPIARREPAMAPSRPRCPGRRRGAGTLAPGAGRGESPRGQQQGGEGPGCVGETWCACLRPFRGP